MADVRTLRKCSDLGDEVRRLKAANEHWHVRVTALKADNAELVGLLQDAFPHVEKMANALATGPIAGPVEHLADDIQTALAKAEAA